MLHILLSYVSALRWRTECEERFCERFPKSSNLVSAKDTVKKYGDLTHQSVISGILLNAIANEILSQKKLLSTSLARVPQLFLGSPLTTICKHVPLHSPQHWAPGGRRWFHGSCAVKFCNTVIWIGARKEYQNWKTHVLHFSLSLKSCFRTQS